jgi:hypothetical protein
MFIMKVILTEKQLELLKMVKENEDTIMKFQTRLNKITDELNKLYTTINFISVAELLNGEIDVKELLSKNEKLDEINLNISREITKYFDSFTEEVYYGQYEDLHNKLDDLYFVNSNKINIIGSILMDLDDLVDENENTKKSFSDIKSINLS